VNGNQTRTCVNTTASCTNTTTIENQSCTASGTNAGIYSELSWNSSAIINGGDFDIEVRAYNLESKNYDVKVYITFATNDTIISDTYNGSKWQSSNYYVKNLFSGPGNASKNLSLRIDRNYRHFTGNAEIGAKIQESTTESLKNLTIRTITVLEKQETDNDTAPSLSGDNGTTSSTGESPDNDTTASSVINLNAPKSIKSQNESQVYRSKTQYIKEYGIYGFALFCVFAIIYLIIKKI
jgi:hypothetical protein